MRDLCPQTSCRTSIVTKPQFVTNPTICDFVLSNEPINTPVQHRARALSAPMVNTDWLVECIRTYDIIDPREHAEMFIWQ